MAIQSTDIVYRLSGGASNSDPAASLGGAKSSTAAGTNIFDNVSSSEASAGDVEHRCIYVHNAHGSLTLQGARVWIQSNTPSTDTTVAIALAGEGVNGTAETVGNESTAPSGESFTTPTDYAGGLVIGDIPSGQHQGIWIRRTVSASAAAYNNDGFTLRVQGDTAA